MNITVLEQSDRVRARTAPDVLHRIDNSMQARIQFYGTQQPNVISRRIEELENEWDVERWLETNASSLALAGIVLGSAVSRKWLLLSGTVLSFLLLHALHGWCPPLPVLRRLGVRTQREIDAEIYALKLLRGDADAFLGAHPEHTQGRLQALATHFAQ